MAQITDLLELGGEYPDAQQDMVVDESTKDETVAIESYHITSFGADYDVEGLVKRLNRKDILIPAFQRDYVWSLKDASRFIESLLLGLPVPGVFFAREQASNKLLVIDGQQRLKTLQFFYNGHFNPRQDEKVLKVFKLAHVQPKFANLTYETLDESDRVKLNDSIIHATIVRQEAPEGDDTSIYYIFQRLNYGGRRLAPQEIRVAIYHGPLMDGIKSLNAVPDWRDLYGKENPRLKDQELILRFFAFLVDAANYRRPMEEFLNAFAARNRNLSDMKFAEWADIFQRTITVLFGAIGKGVFRLDAALNAAVFDSVMVGMERRLRRGPIANTDDLKASYSALLADPKYIEAVSRSTADDALVTRRMGMATDRFATVT